MELFETFDDNGAFVSLVERSEVHRLGLLHRASQVFVINSKGQLLLQQRSAHKDLYPNRWDSSVGEHLKPGESFLQGALRGLYEELGVTDVVLAEVGASLQMKLVGEDYIDYEKQQLFRARFDGPFAMQTEEVQALKWVSFDELSQLVSSNPEHFAPWFLRHLTHYSANVSS